VALLGDTLHNFADAATALPLWVAFTLGRRPATRRYTYGFGRAEDLARIAIVLTIAASAAVAGFEAVQRLLHPQDVENLGWVAVAAVAGFLGNEVAAQYRIRTGRRIGSAALVADGLHARTDGLTSLGVLVGAVGVALGFQAADPIMGILITAAIVFVMKDAARSIYYRLRTQSILSWSSGHARLREASRECSASMSCGCAGSAIACTPKSTSPLIPTCR